MVKQYKDGTKTNGMNIISTVPNEDHRSIHTLDKNGDQIIK